MCSVHRGMFSASRVFSTSGEYHEYIGGYHVLMIYRGTSGVIMSTPGVFSTLGDIMSTSGDVQYIRGIP